MTSNEISRIFSTNGKEIFLKSGQIVPVGSFIQKGQSFSPPTTEPLMIVVTKGKWDNFTQSKEHDKVELRELKN